MIRLPRKSAWFLIVIITFFVSGCSPAEKVNFYFKDFVISNDAFLETDLDISGDSNESKNSISVVGDIDLNGD